jgi:hypothetical protein
VSTRKKIAPCLALAALLVALLGPSAAQADFGLKSFSVAATNEDGSIDTQAGSHPYEYTVSFEFNQDLNELVEGNVSQLTLDLPPGLVGNPQAVPQCKRADFVFNLATICPGDTQVGLADLKADHGGIIARLGVYNLTPSPGVPATLGLTLASNNSFQDASLRSGSDFGIRISDLTLPTSHEIQSVSEHIWGLPMDASHDAKRYCPNPINPEFPSLFGCESEAPLDSFLTLPTSCGEPLETTIKVSSLQEPGNVQEATALSVNEAEEPVGLDGCNALQFEPKISSQPTTNLADSPTGLDFNLHQPQPPALVQSASQSGHCGVGSWVLGSSSADIFAFRWLRNGVPIPGASAANYAVKAADAGSALQCEVLGSSTIFKTIGPGHALSAAVLVAPAAGAAPVPGVSAVSIAPEAASCDPGAWDGALSFAYRWFKNGDEVPGQTESTYQLTPGDFPLALQCEALGTNPVATVAAISPVANSNPPVKSSPFDSVIPPKISVSNLAPPLGAAHLKDATVTLPQGLAINPSVANGLGACSESEIGYAPSGGQIHFTEAPQSCPDASKLGSIEVSVPLLDHKLAGAVYAAKPFQNPFGSLVAIYLAVENEHDGIVAKLAGKVTPDPQTGQLTTTFTESPQLPLEDVDLHFSKGPRAALKTPLACGKYTTSSSLVPWSTPEGETEHPSDSFQTSVAAGGSGACPSTEAGAPNNPSFSAGTIAPQAGAYSPFVLKITRQDGSQRLSKIDTTLPKGLTGKLAGVPYCSEAQIAQAKAREAPNQGAVEQANPSCPAASEVGTVTVGAGAGISPFYAQGHAYLAGPYKGAQLSLAIITPAVAGPFDLGAVVVRTPLYVDPETTQIHAVSDPIPSIIEGVPLDVRSIALKLGRPEFTLNPTSCVPTQVLGSATSTLGSNTALASPFQVGGCNSLKFKPKVSLRLKGSTKRGRFPALKAVVSYPPGSGYANTASAQVTLPHAQFIEQGHFKTICTKVQFAANACPAGSIYGSAKAYTPLLDQPVQGPVYLRSSTHELPDLVIAFKGQVDAVLVGKVDTGKNGGIRNTFEAAPDVPVSKVVLEMQGAKKGLLVNSENICRKEQRAIAHLVGQNGLVSDSKPLVKNDCKGKARKAHKAKKGKR